MCVILPLIVLASINFLTCSMVWWSQARRTMKSGVRFPKSDLNIKTVQAAMPSCLPRRCYVARSRASRELLCKLLPRFARTFTFFRQPKSCFLTVNRCIGVWCARLRGVELRRLVCTEGSSVCRVPESCRPTASEVREMTNRWCPELEALPRHSQASFAVV